MINLIIGFLLWPISGVIYVGIYNLICRLRKVHPMAYHEYYNILFGIIYLMSFDIFIYINRYKKKRTFNSTIKFF